METAMSAKLTDEQRQRIHQRAALKAPTSSESVAETIVFLLDERSGSITGQNVVVDGGST
jgi:3-oxoacyl-[acyl-carrier protein] reductase